MTLFDDLQSEFCPALDPSLIAALLVDIECDGDGNLISPSNSQLDGLRATLTQLSLDAEPHPTLETSIAPFSRPLGFLQTTLPDIPVSRLEDALVNAERDADLWDIVASILTNEFVRDLEERGLDAFTDDDSSVASYKSDSEWETISKKKVPSSTGQSSQPPQSISRPRPKKLILSDIRQQHHAHKPTPRKEAPAASHVPDPWTRLSSLSTRLASLLPPHPQSLFSSFFHSPEYSTSYDALRSCLFSLRVSPVGEISGPETAMLFSLLDIILPQYEGIDVQLQYRIVEDVQLALAVANGREDDILDIVQILRDLDEETNIGLSHKPAPSLNLSSSERPANTTRPANSTVKKKPPLKPPISSPTTAKVKSGSEWQQVPFKSDKTNHRHHLTHDKNSQSNGKASKSRTGGDGALKRQLKDARDKSKHAVMEATRMWQKANAKNRGGEVALYYAEVARNIRQSEKEDALNAARDMVLATRSSSPPYTIDLHGATVAEAIVITKEILSEPSSLHRADSLLTIITGQGKHSVGKVGVLKPAVRKALVEDGWLVSSWDGGLIVRGRR